MIEFAIHILGILLCLAILVVLLGALAAMVAFSLLGKEPDSVGPWVIVNDNEEGLSFPGGDTWEWTSVKIHVHQFPVEAEAHQWAALVGGEVKPSKEVTW